MKIDQNLFQAVKDLVLQGVSGYAAAKQCGLDPLAVAKQLSRDPDIAAAKASGAIQTRIRRKANPTHYAKLPWVVDVLQNGMTQAAAAEKHGISQGRVSQTVRRAQEESAPPPPPQPPTDPELQAITLLISSYAARHNLSTKQVLHLLDK